MHGPAMSGWLLMALCGTTGAYCLVRMRGCPGAGRGAAGDEALMAFGMAAMAVPQALLTLPGWAWVMYALVFGTAAVAALRPARHGAHRLHHLVGSLAMVYMAAAMVPGGAHAAHATAGVPLLTGALLVYYVVYVLRSGVRLVPAAAGMPADHSWDPRPELAPACRLAMGVAMLAMLLML